jgi:hypothetical protein
MSRMKPLLGIILTIIISLAQVGGVFAAPASQGPAPVTGKIEKITLETDPNSGITTVIIDVLDTDQVVQTLRVSQEIARVPLGLIVLNGDGNPVINNLALGKTVEIDPTAVIPDQEKSQHPVGSALARFFSDIADEETLYNAIMDAHIHGVGFGVIAQALWLTQQVPEGDLEEIGDDLAIFKAFLFAKQNNDYHYFILNDSTTPTNWGQLRKAILDKKNSVGIVISNHDNNGNHGNENGNNKDKNKDKNNNGNGYGHDK